MTPAHHADPARERDVHLPANRRSARRRPLRRRRLRWATAALGLILVAVLAWIAIRGALAKQEIEAAVPLARSAQQQVLEGDAEGATTTAQRLAAHAATAAALTSDPAWRAAELLPWVGGNLETMRAIAASVDRVAEGAVTPLARAAADLDLAAFAPSNGRVDLAPVLALRDPVQDAARAMQQARAIILDERIATADVVTPLADARAELTGLLGEAGATIDGLDRVARLAPLMLGSEEPRNILLLFQNNAELRSTGGIPGALALLRAEGGALSLAAQADTGDFPKFEQPVVALPIETRALYGDNTASYIQDVNFTPQFPLAASIAREMWKRQFGHEVDSVIALDPVVLSRILVATGPVLLPTGDTLTSANAVQLLLRDVYSRYSDPTAQDEFFAAATAAVFQAISGDTVDPRGLVDALIESGYSRRLLVWNADPAEQAVLEGTSLAGELPRSTADADAFGVYFNDITGAKMDPYLDVRIAAGSVGCRNDGRRTTVIEVSMTNTAPADAAVSLPPYVTANGKYGTPPGVIATAVRVYAGPGNYNLGVERDGIPAPHHPTSDSGYTLSGIEVRLAPGESASYRFGFLAGDPGERFTEIITTPFVYEFETSALAVTCESALW